MTDRPLPGSTDTAVGPTPGYYPDPSVPGFVRYWGGTAWVPGTSRPAPVPGELLEPPRFTARQAASQAAAAPFVPSVVPPPGVSRSVAETGPMYFDQTSGGVSFTLAPEPSAESAQIELRPRGDVEAHRTAEDGGGAPRLEPVPGPLAGPQPGQPPGAVPGAFPGVLPGLLPGAVPGQLPGLLPGSVSGAFPGSLPGQPPGALPGALSGQSPGALPDSLPSTDPEAPQAAPAPSRGSGWWADPGAQPGLLDTGDALQQISWGVPRPTAEPVAGLPAAPTPVAVAPEPLAPAATARESGAPAAAPRESGTAAAVALPVQASARTRKAATAVAPDAGVPGAALSAAGLGARLFARLLDALVVAVVGVAAGVPLVTTSLRHLQEKLDQARMTAALTGRQAEVWLVDPAVLTNAAALLAVLALLGFLCEVLPTARTGQTFGKRLMRIRVVDATQRAGRKASAPPSLGRSTVRWLVGQLALVLLVGPLWPLLDRRSRRGWQDRAARTRVVAAGRS